MTCLLIQGKVNSTAYAMLYCECLHVPHYMHVLVIPPIRYICSI